MMSSDFFEIDFKFILVNLICHVKIARLHINIEQKNAYEYLQKRACKHHNGKA